MGDLVTAKPIVRVSHDRRIVTSSKDVASYFGKRHGDVIRSVETLLSHEVDEDRRKIALMFSSGFEEDTYGRCQPTYDMTRDGFTLLAMGFTGAKALKFKLAYIAEFNAMEAALKAPPPVSTEIAQLAATVAQMAVTIADIQKSITRLLPAPAKKDDRKERLDELKPIRVGCRWSIMQWSLPMWAGWGVTLTGDDFDLDDWRDALPIGFDPHVLDARLEGTERVVMQSSGWARFTSANIVFDDACRLIRHLNGIIRLFHPDAGSVRADQVYFIDQAGKLHRHQIANTGEMRARERGDRARFIVQVGENQPKHEQTAAQRLCANAELNSTSADIFSYLSTSDNYFDLYKAMEATEDLLGGETSTVIQLGGDSGRTWKQLKQIVNCHRHHPNKRCIELMSRQPAFDELRTGVLQLIAQIQLAASGKA